MCEIPTYLLTTTCCIDFFLHLFVLVELYTAFSDPKTLIKHLAKKLVKDLAQNLANNLVKNLVPQIENTSGMPICDVSFNLLHPVV